MFSDCSDTEDEIYACVEAYLSENLGPLVNEVIELYLSTHKVDAICVPPKQSL